MVNHGNQHASRKGALLTALAFAHTMLDLGEVRRARYWLGRYRRSYALAPASTRRRWKCGK